MPQGATLLIKAKKKKKKEVGRLKTQRLPRDCPPPSDFKDWEKQVLSFNWHNLLYKYCIIYNVLYLIPVYKHFFLFKRVSSLYNIDLRNLMFLLQMNRSTISTVDVFFGACNYGVVGVKIMSFKIATIKIYIGLRIIIFHYSNL